MDVKIDSFFMKKALRARHYKAGGWIHFPEFRVCQPYTGKYGWREDRRIDYIACAVFPYLKYKKIAYEIKVSKADFYRDTVEKRKPFIDNCNEFYYVVPKGLLKKESVPNDCGLIFVNEKGQTRIIKRAPFKEVVTEPCFYHALMLRCFKETGKIDYDNIFKAFTKSLEVDNG